MSMDKKCTIRTWTEKDGVQWEEGHLVVTFPDGREEVVDAADILNAKELNEAVFLTLGAVSVCWDDDRVFESTRARAFGEVLLHRIKSEPVDEVAGANEDSSKEELWADLQATRRHYKDLVKSQRPNLGLATTRELIAEISARIELDYSCGGGGLNYTTISGRPTE